VHKNPILRQIRARPRLLTATLAAIVTILVVPTETAGEWVTRALVAWNVGTWLYIALIAIMMARSSQEGMQRRARLEGEGPYVVLGVVVFAVVASLAAIAGELGVMRDVHGTAKAVHVALAALTVLSSWAFMHLVFALHYAHNFYAAIARGHKPGLAFPGD